MKAIITVIGKDTVGILSKVSSACAEYSVNILEVTQSVLQDMFAMVMLVDTENIVISLEEFRTELNIAAESTNTKIHLMHEDVFNNMHHI